MQYITTVLDFICTYGFVIIVALIIIIGLIIKIKSIINGNIVEWLINKVADAEAYFSSGTGQIKLRAVYDVFCKDRPFLSFLISFNTFSKLVDSALEKFRSMLSEDTGVAEWFENLKKEKGKNKNDESIVLPEDFIDDSDPDKDVDINVEYFEFIEGSINNSIE